MDEAFTTASYRPEINGAERAEEVRLMERTRLAIEVTLKHPTWAVWVPSKELDLAPGYWDLRVRTPRRIYAVSGDPSGGADDCIRVLGMAIGYDEGRWP